MDSEVYKRTSENLPYILAFLSNPHVLEELKNKGYSISYREVSKVIENLLDCGKIING
jgi:hypothetical protein